MTNRSSVVTVLVLLAFVLAAYLVYTRIIRQPPHEMNEVVVCAHCQHVFLVKVSARRGGAPYECERCKQKSAYLAFQCRNPECRAIFPVTPEEMARGEEILCPDCGDQAEVLLNIPEDADSLAEKVAQ